MTVSKCKKELREKRTEGKTSWKNSRKRDQKRRRVDPILYGSKIAAFINQTIEEWETEGREESRDREIQKERERPARQASNSHSRDCQTTLAIVLPPHMPPLLPHHIRNLLPYNFEKGTLRRHLCETSFWPSSCLPCCGAVSKFFAEIKCHRCKWQTVNDER